MPTLSLRVPEITKQRLNRTAKKLHRSQSSLMLEALEYHLDKIQQAQAVSDTQSRFAKILAFKGVGMGITGGQTAQEIDDFRADE